MRGIIEKTRQWLVHIRQRNNVRYFARVYKKNLWLDPTSRSGLGSQGEFAEQKMQIFKEIIQEYPIRTLLDIGCGDLYWMQSLTDLFEEYIGVDIVESLIDGNQRRYGKGNTTFMFLDLSRKGSIGKLPTRDVTLVSCIDVIGHMKNNEVTGLLTNILLDLKPEFFLVTNRRDESSSNYLRREKSRLEGIDIENHPVFKKASYSKVQSWKAKLPNDHFDLFKL